MFKYDNQSFILFEIIFIATLILGSQPRQRSLQGCAPRGNSKVTPHVPRSVRKCEGMNLHTPKWTPCLGDGVSVDSWIFRKRLQGSKLNSLRSSLYHWKALNKSYNFDLYLILIEWLHAKLWGPKVARVPMLIILGLPLRSPRPKCHLDVSLVEKHKIYYKGEGGGFPKFGSWWVLWVRVCSWLVLAPRVFQLCTNWLVVWFVQICVSD